MANNNQTIFQTLTDVFRGGNRNSVSKDFITSTDAYQRDKVLYTTRDKDEYEKKLATYRQQKYLAYQWKKANADNSIESLAGYNAVKLMYRDADLMDGTCEIGAALDIISEEACLDGNTKIKLLNGKEPTIKELFEKNATDFWVYSVDSKGICMPSHVDGVIYKGLKKIIEFELDDGTLIKSTEDHKWMLSDCTWKMSSELKIGDSLMSIYDTKNNLGYEQIQSSVEDKKRLTHQIVAENVLHDEKLKLSQNNRIKSINICEKIEPVYDLLNSSVNNCFGVKCNNGLIISHNCPLTSDGMMLNVHSKSSRTKSILEDLFINRLHIYTDLPMIARHMCKYGNTFQLLNIDKENGVMGWMMMPVYEVDREENGYGSTMTSTVPQQTTDIKPDEVRFVWKGHNGDNPYFNWQVAHFRLLNDSFFLPYGVSLLHKARRAWRMWSMMEDAMLIWRLDKAIERRVYKVYVGAIDDADVPAYINEIANNFKRTQIIDPATGQVDLRKNFLDVSSDYFIPVRREDAPNPIETLQAANSQVQMEDIEYMQNKIFAALRVPKTFLNFQEAQGKGQNLSFMDVRFSRMINRVQQFLLMELNKIAMIHLYIMGLSDEIGNFQLTLNTPSTTIEAQELEDLNKRLSALQVALTDPGTGMPMMSIHKALKKIMKMNDKEILDMFNEIRLEKAMAAELQATANIIKHTGMFDVTDRIYGDYEAMHNGQQQQQQQGGGEDEMGGGIGGGGLGLGGDIGGDDMGMDLGEPGSEGMGDLGGEMGSTDMGGAPSADEGAPIMESNKNKVIKENKIKSFTKKYIEQLSEQNNMKNLKPKSATEIYFYMLNEGQKIEDGDTEDPFDFETKSSTLQENVKNILNNIDSLIDEDEINRENIIEEAIKDLNDFSGNTTND